MKKICVGASKPRKFKIGAWFIRNWEGTEASHVYFYIKRATGVHLLYHAVGSGTEFWGYNEFLQKNQPLLEKEVEVSDEQFTKLLDYVIPKLKNKYSKKHLVGLFIKRLTYYVLRINIPNLFKDEGASEVCVECLCLAMGEIDVFKIAEDPEDLGMKEAMVILKSMPGKESVL